MKRNIRTRIREGIRYFEWSLPRRKWLNDIRQFSGPVIISAVLILIIGILGVINGPLPYLRIRIYDSYIWEIHNSIDSEFVGIGVTILLIDTILRGESIQELKRRLIREMASKDNGVALQAVTELRVANWLIDGSLQHAALVMANLQDADLSQANLEQTNLREAILQNAMLNSAKMYKVNLNHANLYSARLHGSQLHEARLTWADMREVRMMHVQLEDADLTWADLSGAKSRLGNFKGAKLEEANLEGTIFREAEFGSATILPDGTNWTPDTDLERFTDRNHPEFWRSDEPQSPAYVGKKGA